MENSFVRSAILFLVVVFATVGAAFAEEETEQPLAEPGAITIDSDKLLAMLRDNPPPVVIDARIETGRQKGYIEGSLPLPDVETNCDSLGKLIPAKDTPVAFYCSSHMCGRSLNSVRVAKSCGYTTVFWFRGGFTEWKQSGLPFVKGSTAP